MSEERLSGYCPQEAIQLAINSATEKLTTELKDQHSRQVELVRQLETSQAAVGENCKTIDGLTKDNELLKANILANGELFKLRDQTLSARIKELESISREYVSKTDPLLACCNPSDEIPKCGTCRICLLNRIKELENELARLNGQTNYEP